VLLGIEPIKFGIAMKGIQVWIAAGPYCVAEAGFPCFPQSIEGVRFSSQIAVQTCSVVQDRSFVGAQGDRSGSFQTEQASPLVGECTSEFCAKAN